METVKTALVVVLLLAVLYGVYVVLNKPDFPMPPELAWQQETTGPLEVETGMPGVKTPATLPPLTPPPEMSASLTPIVVADDASQRPSATLVPPADPLAAEGVATPAAQPLTGTETPGTPPANAQAGEPEPAAPVAQSPATDDQAAAEGATVSADMTAPAGPPDGPGPERLASTSQPSIYELPSGGTPSPISPPADPLTSSTSDVPDDGQAPAGAFEDAWNSAVRQLNDQRWAEALLTLSLFHDKLDVSGQQRQRLIDLLDPLAGKVIYSPEHLLEPPYEVRPGETLQQIADSCQLPLTLLQNINGITDPQTVAPGTVLKVLRGPFRAEVHLQNEELVLFLGKYYAGRFAISIGNDPAPKPAEYRVAGKQLGREYFAPDGTPIAANAPENPYGPYWLDLGGDICIHASAESMPSHGGLGCISLNSTDAADVYGILSIGSKVLIR